MTPRTTPYSSTDPGFDPKVTLDAVFRRNVLMRPGALALSDPPDRAALTGSLPRRLNYAEADVAVDRLARQLKTLGLPEQAIVAIQLPNTVEAVLALLAVLRAGLLAVQVPMLWRRSDLVGALREIGPRALITTTRLGNERPADTMCEVAAELFTLGFPCAFGTDVPDGVVPLDIDAHMHGDGPDPLAPARSLSAENFAIATFDAARHGPGAIARTHSQLLSAGLAVLMEAKIASGDTIVSTLPPASLAGLAGSFVPWLLAGGMLQLSHGFSPLSAAMASGGSHLVAPAVALEALSNGEPEELASCIAIHRGPESLRMDLSRINCGGIVDLQIFGEIGLTALRRIAKIMPAPIPVGKISAPADSSSAPIVIETKRLPDGTLAVRGAMVPEKSLSIGGRTCGAQLEFDADGFIRTNLKCHEIGGGGLVIESAPDGIVQIGGLRYGLDDLTARITSVCSRVKVTATPHALLGMRCTIETRHLAATLKALDEAGLSSVIIDGVRERLAVHLAAS
jgi:hypothetical protein